eukprot:9090289-Pyramimonas_sp.AAC.2
MSGLDTPPPRKRRATPQVKGEEPEANTSKVDQAEHVQATGRLKPITLPSVPFSSAPHSGPRRAVG